MNKKLGRQLSELLELYERRKDAIQARLNDFSRVQASEYFYELLYCLLTPQSSAEHADKTVSALKKAKFAETDMDPVSLLRRKEHYIRFHNTKSRHLMNVKKDFHSVVKTISNGCTPSELRKWLVSHVKGLGYKEATHFMRNIGKNGGLAILDRHILRNLKKFGAIHSVPKSLSRKQYYSIEKKFSTFAQRIGISLDELDLLFWSMETGEIRK